MWTQFMDMHSGGGIKEKLYQYIYIEAPEAEAKIIFYNRFGHNPDRIACTCCGPDYSITGDSATLAEATAFNRNCEWDENSQKYVDEQSQHNLEIRKQTNTPDKDKWGIYIPLLQYLKSKDVLVIRKKDIKKSERVGKLPPQGYVWVD